MNIPPFIELDRQFTDIPRDARETDDFEVRYGWSFSKGTSWDELVKEHRIVILAGAGAGKTAEIKHATRKIIDDGKYAFFIRLEHLKDGIEDAFESDGLGTYQEFQRWLASSEEEAWLFLDSVDEARLTDPRDFEKALRKLSRALGEHGKRAHIFITSRASEWHMADVALVDNLLPFKTDDTAHESDASSVSDDFGNEDTSIGTEKVQQGKKQKTRVVILNRLNPTRVETFVRACKVKSPDKLIEEIKRQDVGDSIAHPQDLIALLEYWNEHEKVGSRYERMLADIRTKLSEHNPARGRLHPLSLQKAMLGATLLAAAVTLQQKPAIQVPGGHANEKLINSEDILANWDEKERVALLSRAVFDPAIFSSVRFHHRSVREFLTAQWFSDLLRTGKSRRVIEELFFREQYGETVIAPTLRPILPWLALLDEPIRTKTLKVSAEILFENGDPSELPKDVRAKVLTDICDRLAVDQTYRTKIDYSSVRRFAQKDIEDTVRVLLEKYAQKNEPGSLLLSMVWHAKLRSCRDVALAIATRTSTETYFRIWAFQAISALNDEDAIATCIEYVKRNAGTLGRKVVGEFIGDFSPKWLLVSDLVTLLTDVPYPDEHDYTGFTHHLTAVIQAMSDDDLVELSSSLLPLLKAEPYKEPEWCRVSIRHGWLLQPVALAAHRLVSARHPFSLSDTCLSIVSLASIDSSYGGYYGDRADFGPLASKWIEFRNELFWHDVRAAREISTLKGERVIGWYQARLVKNVWSFDLSDFDYIVSQVSSNTFADDRLVAQSLAYRLYVDNEKPPALLEKLKEHSNLHENTCSELNAILNPPPLSEEQKKRKHQEANYKRQNAQRKRKDQLDLEKSKVWLKKNIAVLTDTSVAEKGTVWNAQSYLQRKMRDSKDHYNRWGLSDWKSLIPTFGDDVSKAFRDGTVAYWRVYEPTLRSDGIENPSSVPYAVTIGLTGLEIEAKEIENWPAALTEAEAKKASRYAMLEMNGFPLWLPKLFACYPGIVTKTLALEIVWELEDQTSEKEHSYVLSDVAWHGPTYDDALAPLIVAALLTRYPQYLETLENALTIILRSTSVTDREVAGLAERHLQTELPTEHLATWCAVLISVCPEEGLVVLEKLLARLSDDTERTQFCMHLVVHLNSERRSKIAARQNYKSAHHLYKFLIILHQHIRVGNDINRSNSGVYSPELRDDAQRARDAIMGVLKDIPGKATYLSLMQLSLDHPHEEYREWMRLHAHNRAVLDADLGIWKSSDIADFARDAEKAPANDQELFLLARSRLLDLQRDLEHGDESNAPILAKLADERRVRIYVSGEVRKSAFGKYNVSQENELADAKRPDIRFSGNGFDSPVPCELKIADLWSGNVLFERLENQLSNDYLRDERSRFGIFLLVRNGEKQSWELGEHKRKASFDELCAALQQQADLLISSRPDKIAMTVIGIDLTKRAAPIRTKPDNKKAKKAR